MRMLIADSGKASLVMTSEVFKDHFPGVQVVVARTSQEALDSIKDSAEPFDLIIIDYDLPDQDGIATVLKIKKLTEKPVLMTALDREGMNDAIHFKLAPFEDCINWIRKPVRPEGIVDLVKRLLSGAMRCDRRVPCQVATIAEFSVGTRSQPKIIALPVQIEDVSIKGMRLRFDMSLLGRITAAQKRTLEGLRDRATAKGVTTKVWLPELEKSEELEKKLKTLYRTGVIGEIPFETKQTENTKGKKITLSSVGKKTQNSAKLKEQDVFQKSVVGKIARVCDEAEAPQSIGFVSDTNSSPHLKNLFYALVEKNQGRLNSDQNTEGGHFENKVQSRSPN